MRTIVAITTSIIIIYAVSCLYRELRALRFNFLLTEKQKSIRLSILISLVAYYLVLLFLFFSYDFLSHDRTTIEAFLLTFFYSMVTTGITRFLRKERNGEDLQLSFSHEIQRHLTWKFLKREDFEKFVDEFAQDYGGKIDVINYSAKDLTELKSTKAGTNIPFEKGTYLVKQTDEFIHDYTYHNKGPLVFSLHLHEYAEDITPLEKDIIVFTIVGGKLIKHVLKVGRTISIPANVWHAAVFPPNSPIRLKWY